MYQPDSTYRIQFNASFTFKDLAAVIPYLDQLGIRTIYASPIFAAMPGSGHGYDGTDPNRINPEIGTYEELQAIAGMLKQRNMGWMQDFVPNHMAYSIRNAWLCDFLEKGKMSDYDSYFDKNPDEPVMAPFLGDTLEEALEQKQLTLTYNNGMFKLCYSDNEFPLNYTAYFDIINHELLDPLQLDSLRGYVEKISQITDKNSFNQEWVVFRDALQQTIKDARIKEPFLKILQKLSRQKGFLRKLHDVQFYRLCKWSETDTRINYRRFFTINGLICMNIQDPTVFGRYHELLHRLVKDRLVQAVRIDHIDGLYDPEAYLQQLRNLLGDHTYITVEKILGEEEQLPVTWPVQGTTGYDFLSNVNQVLICREAGKTFTDYYQKLTSGQTPVPELIARYKKQFLENYMQGEEHNLLEQFKSIAGELLPKSITGDALKSFIADLLVYCPVYRYYPGQVPFDPENLQYFEQLLQKIDALRTHDPELTRFFHQCFTVIASTDKSIAVKLLHFWRRCMQLSGPLMAKGVEDTLVYNYQPLLALNEVGSDLNTFGITTAQFHQYISNRLRDFPLAMNATATHDTKRGEESRSRLQYLSRVADEWQPLLEQWIAAGAAAPLPAKDRHFIIQVLYSTWNPGEKDNEGYRERLAAFLVKAAREAKAHSSWSSPDEAYEQALINYSSSLLGEDNPVGRGIRRFLEKHQSQIVWHSLMQIILKCTCPGIPDIYQCTENPDLSFVDPDNRRPVDYRQRAHTLEQVSREGATIADFLEEPRSPAIKNFVLHRLLNLRKQQPALFSKGSYEPVHIADELLFFTRRHYNSNLAVILSLQNKPGRQALQLPPGITGKVRNLFTNAVCDAADLDLRAALRQYPALVLITEPTDSPRKSGLLLPLFSLASPFGIGGMGREAYRFLEFLSDSHQKIWQLLPLNPLLEENAFSPYACASAFAGEPMYIDPAMLLKDGLLNQTDLDKAELPSDETVHYRKVKKKKEALLKKAWKQFRQNEPNSMQQDFQRFCRQEQHWLDDYVLFTVIKQKQQQTSWFKWPEPLRDRQTASLDVFRQEHTDLLNYYRWVQFIFYRQWQALKTAANHRNIKLIGDIPFYLSHDSSDVWAHRELFMLDEKGRMQQSAGVPPDYFSETGQLWSMPTYNWVTAANDNFKWWLQRLEHNVRWFDYIRLDHFRAFYDYWEVPASHTDATQGSWRKGPQDALFDLIAQYFPDRPFLAEDLGEIHQGVFDFRDRYGLPGMRVLQFGFDPYKPELRDVPHNFKVQTVVYTGTHDNNTITGWYHHLSVAARKALNSYAGFKIRPGKVHEAMLKLAHGSVATWSVILVQDLLGLDENSRINTPSTNGGNWLWRLLPNQLDAKSARRLGKWTQYYNRS